MPSILPCFDDRQIRGQIWLFFVISVLFILHAAHYWSWIEDDTFITLRYAENLVNGKGLVFNEGQRIEGYSNLAWVLLAAGAKSLGADPLIVVRLAGILSGLMCLLLSWCIARKLRPEGGVELMLAPLFLAVSPVLARHSVSGLETAAYAMCFSTSLFSIMARNGSLVRHVFGLASLCLLILLRPEGMVFGLLFLVLARGSILGQRPAWMAFCIALVLFLAWRWWYFGKLLPNTFYFKMTSGESAVFSGIRYTLDFILYNGGIILIGFALVLLMSRHAAPYIRRFLLVIALQAAIVITAGGDWMYHYRFYAPLMPLLAGLLAAGAGYTLAAAISHHGSSRLPSSVLAVVLVITFSCICLGENYVWRKVMPSVQSGQYLSQSYARLGLWLREHTPPGSTIAVSDIGAVGYYSQRTIIDMLGLVDPHIARSPGKLHRKNDPAYVLAQRPDYVILVERKDQNCHPWHWRLSDQALKNRPEFAVDYRLAHSMKMGFEEETARVYERLSER